jgi:hypothetical protein
MIPPRNNLTLHDPRPERNHVPKALLALLVILVSSSASSASFADEAQAQDSPKDKGVAVVETVKMPTKVPRIHERLRAILQDAIKASGWTFVAATPGAECGASAECLPKVAKQTATNYVLRLTGNQNQDDGYDITLELFQSSTSHVERSMTYCDYCDVDRMGGTVSRLVVGMLAHAFQEDASAKVVQKQPEQSPPLVSPAPADNLVSPPTAPQPRSVSWVPWTLIGAGAVAIGYGGWGLYKDGKTSESCYIGQSTEKCGSYSSHALGVVSVVGGSLLAVAGVIWEITTPTHTTTVSASPTHLAFGVRF